MLVLRHLEAIGHRFPSPILTLGNFDGVHLGHQKILRRLVEKARDHRGTSIALTFHPHPAQLLSPDHVPLQLTDWRRKIGLIATQGVDVVIVERFTREFSEIAADDFVHRIVAAQLGVQSVVVGHRVRFGHDRRGDAALLQTVGAQCGIDVEIVGAVTVDGALVSSSSARAAIASGNLRLAAALLGRQPTVAGRVVHGRHRGKGLGFPTANLRIRGQALPPDGVYAIRSNRKGRALNGVANLGFNPTFEEQERSLEVHLFDFNNEIYGERLEVAFVQNLRGEVKFANPQALVEQIRRDVDEAHRFLTDTK